MPYITNAQKEWAQWIDLGFAVRQICTADHCDEVGAVQQLRLAIADGNVRVAWADRPEQYVDEPIFDSSEPPSDPRWWIHHAKFDLEAVSFPDDNGPEVTGSVLDDWCIAPLYMGGTSAVWDWIEERLETRQDRLGKAVEHRIRFRPLLVWSPHIDAIWGWPWPIKDSSREEPADLAVRRPATESVIIDVCREIYAERRADPPNVNDAWKLVREKLPGTPRHKIREVLERPEFKSLRNPVGIRKGRAKSRAS